MVGDALEKIVARVAAQPASLRAEGWVDLRGDDVFLVSDGASLELATSEIARLVRKFPGRTVVVEGVATASGATTTDLAVSRLVSPVEAPGLACDVAAGGDLVVKGVRVGTFGPAAPPAALAGRHVVVGGYLFEGRGPLKGELYVESRKAAPATEPARTPGLSGALAGPPG